MGSHDGPPPASESSSRKPECCLHCGGALELLNVIPRLGARPQYRIYGCVSCKKLEWIEG
jgi:hypothetical protein